LVQTCPREVGVRRKQTQQRSLPERRDVIDGALCAVLARKHVLLLGPPGTAKSALVRAIARAFGGSYFESLVTKFSTPEELFGPISLTKRRFVVRPPIPGGARQSACSSLDLRA
jgi:MoxR-like ATPase